MAEPSLRRTVPELERAARVHVVAAGGAAMSAIAHILLRMGHDVSGSDQVDSAALERLRVDGIRVDVGHDASRIVGVDWVAVSTAVQPGNVELDAAVAAGIPVAGRADVMEALGRMRRTVAVSGTHGKTTTTAMVTLALAAAGWDPSFIVGGVVRQLGSGVAWRDSEWLVVEADESDGSFLRFGAEAVVVTNIEEDHLDHWGSMAALEAGFDAFVGGASGPAVVTIDDAGVRRLVDRLSRRPGGVPGLVTMGQAPDAMYRIVGFEASRLASRLRVERHGSPLVDLELQVPGLHNARNAVGALVVAVELGVDPGVAAAALATFTGVARRFERRGEARGVTFVDDYAHLPTEVAATVQAAAAGGWGRVIAVFEPHRYTRIAALGEAFADSFVGADVVVITGLYAAGQAPIAGVTGRTVADAVRAAHPRVVVVYAETRDELMVVLRGRLRAGDLCLTMNAGELTTLPDQMLNDAWARGSDGPAATEGAR